MKSGLIRLVVAGMMLTGVCAAVAEQAPASAPAPKAVKAAKPIKGMLAAPAAGVDASIVAVLTHKGKEKDKTFNLTCADAAVVATIKDAIAKGSLVTVTGEVSKDGASIAVTAVEAAEKHAKK